LSEFCGTTSLTAMAATAAHSRLELLYLDTIPMTD
jgi:hypothetical protein